MNDEQAIPEVPFSLLGQDLKLVFSMYSMSQIKRLTGTNLLKASTMDLTDPEILVALVWGAMIEKQKKFDGNVHNGVPSTKVGEILENIGRELKGDKIKEAIEAVNLALQNCFGKSEPGEGVSEADGEEKK